jgi:hypothetical protein
MQTSAAPNTRQKRTIEVPSTIEFFLGGASHPIIV